MTAKGVTSSDPLPPGGMPTDAPLWGRVGGGGIVRRSDAGPVLGLFSRFPADCRGLTWEK